MRLPGFASRRYVLISVSDTGEGMTEEVLRRAVEPFFTTKGPGKGSGLGLSMVHGVATQSGGGLHIESWVGRGTAVSVYLPRALAHRPLGKEESSVARGHEHATVLVVDDDADVREVALSCLESLGYRVIAAENGPAALELWRGARRSTCCWPIWRCRA